jgi:hypothetical protein
MANNVKNAGNELDGVQHHRNNPGSSAMTGSFDSARTWIGPIPLN